MTLIVSELLVGGVHLPLEEHGQDDDDDDQDECGEHDHGYVRRQLDATIHLQLTPRGQGSLWKRGRVVNAPRSKVPGVEFVSRHHWLAAVG